MVKKSKMKPDKGYKENKKRKLEQEAQELIEKGEVFGENIIGQLTLIATNPIGMGAAALGLAKAYAALKDVSKRFDVDVDSLFEKELSYFEGKFKELLDQEMM